MRRFYSFKTQSTKSGNQTEGFRHWRYRTVRFTRKQLIPLLLLLSIVPVLLFGTVIYSIGIHLVETEIHRASLMSLTQMREQIDAMIKQTEETAVQFSYQSSLMDFIRIQQNPPLRTLISMNTLQRDLTAYASSNQAIDSVYLYHTLQNIVISPATISSVFVPGGNDLFKDVGWVPALKEAIRQEKKGFWITPRTLVDTLGNSRKVLTYIRTLPLFSSDVNAALVVNIDEGYLRNRVQSFPLGTSGGILVFSSEGVLITQNGEASRFDAGALRQIVAQIPKDAVLQSGKSVLIKNLNQYVTYKRSSLNGWTYVLLVPADKPAQTVQILKKIVFAATAVLSLLSAVTSYFSFYRFRRGIRRVIDLLAKVGGMEKRDAAPPELLYENDIKRIEGGVSFLLQEVSGLRSQWKDLLPLLRTHYLLSALLGDAASLDKLANKPSGELSLFDHPQFAVLLAEMDASTNNSRFGKEHESLFLFAVSNIANELLKEDYPTEVLVVHNHVAIILNLTEDVADSWISQAADRIRYAVRKFLKQTITIAIGRRVGSFAELSGSYRDALQLLHLNWVKPGDETIDRKNEDAPANRPVYYPYVIEQELLNAIREGDERAAVGSLDRFHESMEREQASISLIKTMYLQLLVSVIRLLHEYDENLGSVFNGRNPYEEFLSLNVREDMDRWFQEELLQQAVHFLANLKKRKVQDMIAKTLEFAQNHYTSDLTLQMVADHFKVSSAYISQVFKENFKETFTQYVMRLRIEQAKKLLDQTNLTITQLAVEVGYSNAQHLIRTFKKLENTTPGEYRNRDRA